MGDNNEDSVSLVTDSETKAATKGEQLTVATPIRPCSNARYLENLDAFPNWTWTEQSRSDISPLKRRSKSRIMSIREVSNNRTRYFPQDETWAVRYVSDRSWIG